MSRVEIVPLTGVTREVRHVADNLRLGDRAEVAALTTMTPLGALTFSVERAAEAYVARLDGEAVAVFGAGYSAVGDLCHPWALGTERLHEANKAFMRLSRRFMAHLRPRCRLLENIVHADNAPSIQYLAALGFGFGPVQTLPNGAECRQFTMKGDRYVS